MIEIMNSKRPHRPKSLWSIAPLMLVAAMVTGCDVPNASFVHTPRTENFPKEAQVGGKGLEGEQLKGIKTVINENFGTPNELVAWLKLPVNYGGEPSEEASTEEAQGFSLARADEATLEELRKVPGYHFAAGRALYMEHCLHCHGTSGDGAGPTAEYLNPLPRDYRKGLFKFTSTNEGVHATRGDLNRVIKMGIPGTYMPSFMLLKDEEIDQIVEYVRWLSMRGEVEYALGAQLMSDFSNDAIAERVEAGEKRREIMDELKGALVDMPELLETAVTDISDAWVNAETPETQVMPTVGKVEDTAESRRKGRAIFISAGAKCTNCHGPQGMGNGKQTEEYESNEETGGKWDEPGLHDKWGNIVKPRNLTTGIYRGGRRPIDIFRRVRAGIKGSGMPAFGTTVIPDEDLWHLVNYVKSIPFGQTAPAAAEAAEKSVSEPAG